MPFTPFWGTKLIFDDKSKSNELHSIIESLQPPVGFVLTLQMVCLSNLLSNPKLSITLWVKTDNVKGNECIHALCILYTREIQSS